MIAKQGRTGRARKIDSREVFDAIRYALASSSWPLSTVQNRSCAWLRSGVPIVCRIRCGILRGAVRDAPGSERLSSSTARA